MDYESISDELIELLTRQGVKIRKEAVGGGGGGFCTIKGQRTLFVDTEASWFDTAMMCAGVVETVIGDLESIYLRPAVRDFIDKYGR